MPARPLFTEIQRFTQWWVLLIIALFGGATTGGVVTVLVAEDSGNLEAAIAAVGLALVGLLIGWLLSSSLQVRVDAEAVHIRHLWFLNRTVPLDEIVSVEALTYRPLLQYGGYGWRWRKDGTAYNVRGNKGVKATLPSGKHVLIGSQRHEQLAAAIEEARRQHSPTGDPSPGARRRRKKR